MESDRGTVGGAAVQDGLFRMIARVVDNQLPATVGVAGAQGTQDVTKLQVRRARIARGKDCSRPTLQGGKEIDGARAAIRNLLAFDQSRTQGQGWGQAP